jgi:hypothetical protein
MLFVAVAVMFLSAMARRLMFIHPVRFPIMLFVAVAVLFHSAMARRFMFIHPVRFPIMLFVTVAVVVFVPFFPVFARHIK